MALPAEQETTQGRFETTKCFAKFLSNSAMTAFQILKDLYDWKNGCRKLSIVTNPFTVLNKNFSPESLCENDLKGAWICFVLLAWVLLLIGRTSSLGMLYTVTLTGIVTQYAVLQYGAWVAALPPAQVPTAPVAARSRVDVAAGEDADPLSMRRSAQTRETQMPEPMKPPGLSSVASTIAFCSVPLATCALALQLVSGSAFLVAAPLPAAWCTLLAACALLPRSAPYNERALVILPCGVLFTFLALLYMV